MDPAELSQARSPGPPSREATQEAAG
jgi:hypothetical protein